MLVQQRQRLDDVTDALAHLAAALVQDQAEADDVLVRRLALEQGGQRVQAVEPAPRLVDGLADVVGGEQPFPFHFGVLEGVVGLGKGHCAGVEPAVHHLRDARHRAVALVAGECDFIHVGTVQVKTVNVNSLSLRGRVGVGAS